jgi:phospholipase C
VQVTLTNTGTSACTFTVSNGYVGEDVRIYSVAAHGSKTDSWDLSDLANWYDLSVTVAEASGWLRRVAGHMEYGAPSQSEPVVD